MSRLQRFVIAMSGFRYEVLCGVCRIGVLGMVFLLLSVLLPDLGLLGFSGSLGVVEAKPTRVVEARPREARPKETFRRIERSPGSKTGARTGNVREPGFSRTERRLERQRLGVELRRFNTERRMSREVSASGSRLPTKSLEGKEGRGATRQAILSRAAAASPTAAPKSYRQATKGLTPRTDRGSVAAKGVGKAVPDATVVCRGGSCTADAFATGKGVTTNPATGKLDGVSTGLGSSVASASKNVPHGKVGVTTAGNIRAAGGQVINDHGNHELVSGLTAEKAAEVFKQAVKNPNR